MTSTNESMNGLGKYEKTSKRLVARGLEAGSEELAELSEKIQAVADKAEKQYKRYSEAARDFTKENPFWVAMGILAVGAAGTFLMMRKRKSDS
jgi:LPXTG-motif cell wall-anchored protein